MSAAKKVLGWNLDMPIGMALQIQIVNEDARFKSVYYGMKPNEFLIVQMPGIPGIREKLLGQSSLVVRFVVSGKVYGFKSSVISHVTRPCPLIFLTFPSSIEMLNLRAAERVDTFIEATAEQDEDVFEGVILDISVGGCRYVVNRTTGIGWPDVEPGSTMTLRFQLNGDEEIILDTEVAMSKKEVDKINLGLKFLFNEDNAMLKHTIQNYIDHIQQFMRGGQ